MPQAGKSWEQLSREPFQLLKKQHPALPSNLREGKRAPGATSRENTNPLAISWLSDGSEPDVAGGWGEEVFEMPGRSKVETRQLQSKRSSGITTPEREDFPQQLRPLAWYLAFSADHTPMPAIEMSPVCLSPQHTVHQLSCAGRHGGERFLPDPCRQSANARKCDRPHVIWLGGALANTELTQ